MAKSILFTVVFMFTVGLSGCSFMKIGYKYADWILMGRIDDAFELTDSQEDVVNPLVLGFMKSVDARYLPEIIAHLETMIESSKDGLSVEDSQKIYDFYVKTRIAMLDEIADGSSQFLLTLTASQYVHLLEYFAEQNQSIQEMLELSDEELQEDVMEERFENLERWFGELSDEQKLEITKITNPNRLVIEQRLEKKQAFQKFFIDFVSTTKEAPVIAAAIKSWGRQPELMLAGDLKDRYLATKGQWHKQMATVDTVITDLQREEFVKNMTKFKRDLEGLVK